MDSKLPNSVKRIKLFHILLVILSLLLISIILTLVLIWPDKDYYLGNFGFGPKIAARVDDKLVTVSKVDELAKDCSLSKKDAANSLVDEIVLAKWAVVEKIIITGEEEKAEQIRIGGVGQENNCITRRAKINLLRKEVENNLKKFREGKIIVINFDKHYPFFSNATNNSAANTLLEKDKEYALQLSTSISKELKANKISFDQVIEKVNRDSKVGVNSEYATSPQSGEFTAEEYIQKHGLLNSDQVRGKIDSLRVGQISDPFIQKVNLSADGEANLVDARWLIVRVDKVGKGYSGTLVETLTLIQKQYGARIY